MSVPPVVRARQGYVRSTRGWWLRDPYYVHYMVREATALLVAAYAIVLLVGLLRLSQGEAAYDRWLGAMHSTGALVFQAIVFAAFIYHTWSWFRIMPKTLPYLALGGRRVTPAVITATGLAMAIVASVALVVAVSRYAQ